jgi:hypothetical protein
VILGHKSVQRWNLPGGWVISARSAHPVLVSEADFIATQDINAARSPAPHDEPVLRRYLLAGLLGRTSAMAPGPARPKNTYIREDKRQAIQYLSGRLPCPAGCCVLPGGRHFVPEPAVEVEVIAPRLAGGGVADVGVQRVPVVGELV